MHKIDKDNGHYMRCPKFWWSNNPTLFRLSAMKGILPLNEGIDGRKGSANWSQPELQAGSPPNAWIHKWGVFIHERGEETMPLSGCQHGEYNCKYGFLRKTGKDIFCQHCIGGCYSDLSNHIQRAYR